MPSPIYLDYHATTPVDPRALEAMLPYFTETFGNAASRNHAYGWAAAQAVDIARGQLAALIGARDRDLVFTSGATESNNLALLGVVAAQGGRRCHLVTVCTEHHSVLDTCRHLETQGHTITRLPVDAGGRIDLDALDAAIGDETVLVSVMAANNEIGVLQPLADVGALTRRRGVLLHTDASQAVGKVAFDVEALQVDLAAFTAHKMYGPKGVGALYVRRKGLASPLRPLLHGGGQERGLRSGTLNVPGIVGFGKAAEIALAEMPAEGARLANLRDRLLAGLRQRIPDLRVNGSFDHRLPHNLNVSFPDIEAESLGMALDDVAVSSGSACATGKAVPSHVLSALGLDAELAVSSVRFGLGRWTTEADIDYAADKVARVVARLRAVKAELAGH